MKKNNKRVNPWNLKIIMLSLLCFCISFNGYSQQEGDTLAVKNDKNKEGNSYWNHLIHGNADRTHERKFDISFISAPSYTREASFGMGGMASGLYRMDRTDSIMPPSDITLTFNASLRGFYTLGARGNNYFKGNRSFLSYRIFFSMKPLNFWGIDYEDCARNPVINYTRQQIQVDANYKYKLLDNLYIGATLDFNYTRATKIDDISYLQGQRKYYFATGIGGSLQYDSRDFIPNPQRGLYLMLSQSVFPRFLGDCGKMLYQTTLTADYYQKIRQGTILAFDAYGQFNGNNVPWPLREELGDSQRMRGYYAGQYIDNNIAVGQIELRQHLVQRFGFATWAGVGSVFPSLNQFKVENILPTYGIGLRWEFKHHLNARVDYGFGKQTGGFVFNMGEAF